ncbi:MAG: sensor histidine kinase [Acidobacteriota bacterium]
MLGSRKASRSWLGRGSVAVVFLVAAALAVSLYQVKADASFAATACLLGALYVGLCLGVGSHLSRESPGLHKASYFSLELILLGLIAALFYRHRAFGSSWLLYMPVVSHARILLKNLGTAAVTLAALGILAVHIAALGGWDGVPASLLAVSTAFVFVIVFTDIAVSEAQVRADSQRLSEELESANRRLGEYAVEAEELAMERERARMAREIHDSVGHSLTAVHMQIEAARTLLGRDEEKTRSALDKAQSSIQEGLSEIRRSVSSLRADPLEGRNLHGGLADLADVSEASGLPVDLRISGRQRPLSSEVTLAIFRCAQEGLTNARKHSKARRVRLELDYGSADDPARDEGHVRLSVLDDGQGTERPEGGFGLLGLRERLRQLSGELSIRSSPGEGLELRATVPTPTFGSGAGEGPPPAGAES